jgi:alpha-D-ribose 1-methylphosphonate 5-triphosphate synthase subunit PhnH
MSYPGICHDICLDHHGDQDPLLVLTAQCLIDHEITYHLLGEHPQGLAQSFAVSTGAMDAKLRHADFVIVAGDCSGGRVAQAKRGTLAYPDQGATVIYQLPSERSEMLTSDLLENVVLTGPGIRTKVLPPVAGLDVAELALLRDINSEYPLGVDTFIFWGNAHVMAIPRSTRIEVN